MSAAAAFAAWFAVWCWRWWRQKIDYRKEGDRLRLQLGLADESAEKEVAPRVDSGNVPVDVEIGEQALPALSRSARVFDSAKESNAMTNTITLSSISLAPSLETAWQDVDKSFERFCLTAGIGAMEQMLREDAHQLTGAPHSRRGGRLGHRWGTTRGKLGFHGGKVAVHRPRVRSYAGEELQLPTWTAAQAGDWLGRWAMNLMLINVSTRKLKRAVRLPEGDMAPRNRRRRVGSWRCRRNA
jgi:hypothetical protein